MATNAKRAGEIPSHDKNEVEKMGRISSIRRKKAIVPLRKGSIKMKIKKLEA